MLNFGRVSFYHYRYVPVIWWCFSRFWLPVPPVTRKPHTPDTPRPTTQRRLRKGSRSGFGENCWKLIPEVMDFERLEMWKKSWLMCFFWKNSSSPIYKERLYSHIFKLCMCVCLHRNCRMEITEIASSLPNSVWIWRDWSEWWKKMCKKKCLRGDITKVN